jgi:mannosyltransferase
MIVATYLRLHGISDKSLWADEAVSVAFTQIGWSDLAHILWHREGNMSLYYLLLRAWCLLGHSEAVFRGFSTVWSVATIPVIYALGRRLFTPLTGVIAALLWTVNAYSVRYAQETRSYSMVAFLVTLATYFLIRAAQADSSENSNNRKVMWNWYIALSTLAVYAHFFATLTVIAHVVAFWRTEQKKHVLRAAKWVFFLTLPVWFFIATTGAGPLRWVPRTTFSGLWLSVVSYAGNAGWPLVLLYLLGVLLAVWLRRHDRSLVLLLSWFLVPIGIALLFSVARPMFVPRYFLICIPALILIVAAGFASLRPAWLRVPILAVTCWFAVTGIRSYYRDDFDLLREDFRSASAFIINNSRPGDGIVFHRVFNRFGYAYYADPISSDSKPVILYPTERPMWRDFVSRVTPETLREISGYKHRIWLLASESTGSQPGDLVIQQLKSAMASTHRLTLTKNLDPSLRLYLYE